MGANDPLFRKYLLNMYSGHAFPGSTVCDTSCHRSVLCQCASGDGYLVQAVTRLPCAARGWAGYAHTSERTQCMNNATLHRDFVLKEMVTC
jgi:hypothetical protein